MEIPAFFSAARLAGTGPSADVVRLHPGMRIGDEAGERGQAMRPHGVFPGASKGGGASLMPDALPALAVPSCWNTGLSRSKSSRFAS
jgi:hypothetical protein